MNDSWIRFVGYGIFGWCLEILWTAIKRKITGQERGWRLEGRTYLWMFPIYGIATWLYEPTHDALRTRPCPLRAIIYTTGILSVEYATGWMIRRLTGACPWDYSDRSRWHIHGLIRLDYAPAWAAVGLILEHIHDFLIRLTPAIRQIPQ